MKKSKKLYACVIGDTSDSKLLEELGNRFAYRIEQIEKGIVFEISGLDKLFGEPNEISRLIQISMNELGICGNLAISESAPTAILQARNVEGLTINQPSDTIGLDKIGLQSDLLGVLSSLGMKVAGDLKKIPKTDLIARYGNEIGEILENIESGERFVLAPNFKENFVSWSHQSDFPVLNSEQLFFFIQHGLEKVFHKTSQFGLASEEIKVVLKLENKAVKEYEVKVSFPTLNIKFWLKVLNLKLQKDPPEGGVIGIEIFSFFIRPRSIQNSLFSASAPQPESLLLTVLKIKKLIGNENVGVPIIINQRLSEAFGIDSEKMPQNINSSTLGTFSPGVAFSHFIPPLEAEVFASDKKLVFLRTKRFKGKVKNYGGTWFNSGHWWDESEWNQQEWDVETESGGIYRLARNGKNWLVLGEYD